ncbi:NUDIX domain-containing protein [Leifsonia sp. H3M29-4]|uniref:NUDIX domain-containing protein n=1 Tax=Salinibacterium metalliresistens TaxID=3031321 RepID=UPI0023DAFB66|nr:NUDIX domain-containing protein [Salinibacterium metalliresistens]MDF1478538.1 NUDIX domain-containing protein [Salinibacterium metalliresistens]
MPESSAGILLHRLGRSEVLLGHMGGPFWSRKDAAAWSIPKGLLLPGEPAAAAAVREFTEELGFAPPQGDLEPLGSVTYSSGKTITVFALEGDPDLAAFEPGVFETQWPPGSGRMQSFPELDRIAWFGLDEAREKLVKGQRAVLARLAGG